MYFYTYLCSIHFSLNFISLYMKLFALCKLLKNKKQKLNQYLSNYNFIYHKAGTKVFNIILLLNCFKSS